MTHIASSVGDLEHRTGKELLRFRATGGVSKICRVKMQIRAAIGEPPNSGRAVAQLILTR